MMSSEQDPLLVLQQVNSQSLGRGNSNASRDGVGDNNNYQATMDVTQTYTAGEDASRLALVAKELGLQHQRSIRPPVRTAMRNIVLPTLAGLEGERSQVEADTPSSSSNLAQLLAGVAGNVLEWYGAWYRYMILYFVDDGSGTYIYLSHFQLFFLIVLADFAIFGFFSGRFCTCRAGAM